MRKIASLEDLIDDIGKENVDALFMEYMMMLIAKVNLLDKIDDEASSGCDMDRVRELLEGDEDDDL